MMPPPPTLMSAPRLLASGFGDFASFNHVVQGIFKGALGNVLRSVIETEEGRAEVDVPPKSIVSNGGTGETKLFSQGLSTCEA